jgi:hypothetical protein
MLPHSGQVVDNMTRGGGQRGQGESSGKQATRQRRGVDNARQAGGGRHNRKVIVSEGDDGGTCPCRRPPTLMPLRFSCHCAGRMRGRDPSLSKLRSDQQ